jgi:uncharacterized membrane protein
LLLIDIFNFLAESPAVSMFACVLISFLTCLPIFKSIYLFIIRLFLIYLKNNNKNLIKTKKRVLKNKCKIKYLINDCNFSAVANKKREREKEKNKRRK